MKLGWIVKLHLSHLFFSKIVLNLVLNMHNKGVLIDQSMLISIILLWRLTKFHHSCSNMKVTWTSNIIIKLWLVSWNYIPCGMAARLRVSPSSVRKTAYFTFGFITTSFSLQVFMNFLVEFSILSEVTFKLNIS